MDKGKKEQELSLRDGVKIVFIAILISLFITRFIVSSTTVDGHSMEDSLKNNDRLIVWKFSIDIKDLSRGDIVVFHAPDDEKKDYIKRVIAFPNEYVQIEDGLVYINGERLEERYINTPFTYTSLEKEWFVKEGELFVMGDNRLEGASRDSRTFGAIKQDSLVGKAIFRFFPWTRMGGI